MIPTPKIWRLIATLLLLSLSLASVAEPGRPISSDEAKALARDVYLYAYPIVLMDITMRQVTNVADAETMPMRAPINQFAHFRQYPEADSRDVVRFNFDTLYSFAWLDLSEEPMILSLPDTGERYYLMPMLDMWTDVFSVPGTRTTGNRVGHFAIAGPNWDGDLPTGVDLIRAPTPVVWLMGRTQTNGPDDYVNVHKLQDAYRLTPLSRWGQDYSPPEKLPTNPKIDNRTDPLKQVNSLSGVELLTRFSRLLETHPAHFNDYPILFQMQRLGLGPDGEFDPDKLSPAVADAINSAARETIADLQRAVAEGTIGEVQNGWNYLVEGMGTYGTSYRRRALVAMAGLGANLPEDAIYPNAIVDADGDPTSGKHRYVLHFEKGQLPAVNAFWSLTMYDMDGFQVPNPLNRFAIGDRDKLKFNPDGSLDIYIQHESPGKARESNWLPAPEGRFQVMMRMYSPKAEVLREGPRLPPLEKITPLTSRE
ncbi:DUF1254 domain-containing protein [Microbulbifer celer]|uniref:DUF1254 domain-containing protein n=1 Tax=Microbulbifer celer TaxID=435905 RepID=A0ABW3UBI5_9GAMM|nr:DUF1254 domain-containing protein [Microbulbifer celer]UFN59124.1 DUF1254 domain-containing protein [Microbulbifer celer]